MKKSKLLIALIFLLTISTLILSACGSSGYRTLKIYSVNGTVNIKREEKMIGAAKDMKLKNDDLVVVESSSSAVLKLDKDKFVMAKENTTLKLEATGKKNNTKTRILVNDGGVIVEVKEKLKENESFEIASSNSVMAIRGTRIGFDVSKTSDSVSTNFATLTGKTEIMLLKNENLNSTNLTECLSLTYESKLDDSKNINDMSSLIDSSTIGHINDDDLANVYNTEIREISTYEIDSIVDAVNTFERKASEYINGTIKIKEHPETVEYGVNPKDFIKVDKDYKELNFYYSKELKGDYLGFDEDNVLTPGKWYCKAKSIDAYRSDPFEFEVVEKEIKFTNRPTEVDYGVDPKTVMTMDGNYNDVNFYYSSTIDGEYKLYDTNNPLDLGTYYFKANTLGYKSQIYTIDVVKIKVDFSFDIIQKSYSGTASLDITLDGGSSVFNEDFASTPSSNKNIPYEYYVSLTYKDSSDNTYSVYFDKDDKNKLLDFVFSGESSASFDIDYNLPYYYEVISGDSLTFNFQNSIDMDNTVILCKEREYYGTTYRSVDILLSNYYTINEESKVKLFYKRVAPFTGVVTYIPLDSLNLNPEGNEILVIETYEYDGENKNKGYYEYELDFSTSSIVYTASVDCNSIFLTYNDNDTMNVYFDIVCTCPSADAMAFVTLTTDDGRVVPQTYMAFGKDSRFAVFEDIIPTDYHVTDAHVVIKYNGVCYVLRSADTDYSYINSCNSYYYEAKYVTSNNETTISWKKDGYDISSPMTIHADESDFAIESSLITSDDSLYKYTIDGVYSKITLDATYYSVFFYTGNAVHTDTFVFEDDGYNVYLSDKVFNSIKEQMEDKYGITVKGSNKYSVKGLIVENKD